MTGILLVGIVLSFEERVKPRKGCTIKHNDNTRPDSVKMRGPEKSKQIECTTTNNSELLWVSLFFNWRYAEQTAVWDEEICIRCKRCGFCKHGEVMMVPAADSTGCHGQS